MAWWWLEAQTCIHILYKSCGEPSLLDQCAQYKFQAWRHPYDKNSPPQNFIRWTFGSFGHHWRKEFESSREICRKYTFTTFIICMQKVDKHYFGLKEVQPESTSLWKNLNPTLSNPNLDPGGSTQPDSTRFFIPKTGSTQKIGSGLAALI